MTYKAQMHRYKDTALPQDPIKYHPHYYTAFRPVILFPTCLQGNLRSFSLLMLLSPLASHLGVPAKLLLTLSWVFQRRRHLRPQDLGIMRSSSRGDLNTHHKISMMVPRSRFLNS